MTPEQVNKALADIKAAIEKARFEKVQAPFGATAYRATSEGWEILALTFPGHRTTQRGFDGTAVGEFPLSPEEAVLANPPKRAPLLVHLTPELAKQAVELAEKQVMS